MFTIEEMKRSLYGSWRLLTGKADGMAAFDGSVDAFWRSFLAIILVAPFFALHAYTELGITRQSPNFQPDTFSLNHYVVVQTLLMLTDWVAFPILMVFLARLLNVTQQYGRYITAFNWSSVAITLMLSAPLLLYMLGILPQEIAGFISLALLLIALKLRWFLATLALGVGNWTAIGLVVIEFAISLMLTGVADYFAPTG